MERHLYPVLFNNKTFYEYNIQKIYKIRYKILNKLLNELVEYIFEKYLNFNGNYKMYSDINKYKNLKIKPNDCTFLPFTKLNIPNYICNKKDDIYIICYTHQELCTESFHNMQIANCKLLNLSSRKINKDNLTDQLYQSEQLINEQNKLNFIN